MGWLVEPAKPSDPEVRCLVAELSDALLTITGDDGRSSSPAGVDDDLHFVLARDHMGNPVGCGAIRTHDIESAEIKRMYARPGTRGVGHAVLQSLETKAREKGYARIVLSTRRINGRAVGFYLKHGFLECEAYGRYVGRSESVCMTKSLGSGR